MWYEIPSEDEEEEITFCDMLQEREDLVIYTCDDSEISLYKWDVEYNFELVNWVLNTFTIDDENLLSLIEGKLKNLIYIKDNTPTIITSIIDFSLETKDDDWLESKIEIIDQFRIHFKLVPDDIRSIEWTQNEFMVDLTLWKIKLQARYNIETHMLTNISYVACEKTLEIRDFELQINSESEPQLAEILNNPQVYLATLNAAAYKKYQRLCDTD